MTQRQSRLVLLGFLAFAAASATGGVLYQTARSRQPLDFFGQENARRMLHAPRVDWLRLQPAEGEAREVLTVAGRTWRIAERREITAARGLRNIRYALLDRGTYDWDRPVGCQPEWTDALEFVDGGDGPVVAFSFDCPAATGSDSRTVSLSPTALSELKKFFEEQTP